MTFFERYEKLCLAAGYKPVSEQAAQALGTNRGTISAWKTSGNPPRMEFIVAIANTYHVSTDYLLERTDDPTDYSKSTQTVNTETNLQNDPQQSQTSTITNRFTYLYSQLDDLDKCKAEGYIQGLLSQDKYTPNPIDAIKE